MANSKRPSYERLSKTFCVEAIVALLGGERMSTGFVDNREREEEKTPDADRQSSKAPGSGAGSPDRSGSFSVKTCPICETVFSGISGDTYCPQHIKLTKEEIERLMVLTLDERVRISKLDDKFATVEPSKPHDEWRSCSNKFWALYSTLRPGMSESGRKAQAHVAIEKLYKKKSFKDLTIPEFRDLISKVVIKIKEKFKVK